MMNIPTVYACLFHFRSIYNREIPYTRGNSPPVKNLCPRARRLLADTVAAIFRSVGAI